MLQATAERLNAARRADDYVARLGGDEFLVIASITQEHDAELIASRLRESIARPIDVGTESVCVTASIGIALADSGADLGDSISVADAAMYQEKTAGGDLRSSAR